MAYVTVINDTSTCKQIVSGHHHLTADEPVAAGGSMPGSRRASCAGASSGLHRGALRRGRQNDGRWGRSRWACAGRATRRGRITSSGAVLHPAADARAEDSLLEVAAATPVTSVLARRHRHPVIRVD